MNPASALVWTSFLTGVVVAQQPKPASLVLRGGKIVTLDQNLGTVRAIAVRADRIIAAGTVDEIRPYVGASTRVVDLDGKLAVPGFIEGHGHFTGIGRAKQILDLTKVKDWDEVVDMVAAAAERAPPGEWILGRGWHQEKWVRRPERHVAGFPTHQSLSAVSPDNPVVLTHASGHACFVNAKAMDLAGIRDTTPNPAGGEILRDADGHATGVFNETAQGLVRGVRSSSRLRRTREQRRADLERTLRLADRECVENGVTSFQDAGTSFSTVDGITDMVAQGKIDTRLWIMIRDSNARMALRLAKYRKVGFANHHLTVRAIKRSIDGALGSRGAWLLEPYSDAPDTMGHNTASIASVTETARLAVEHGYQLCVHAIGDRANREVLNIFEEVLGAHPELKDHRWRIEHAQHLHPADIPRFAALGVIASMQGVHCTSDAPWVVQRLGKRRAEEGAYVWQKLMRSGAIVTNGTDAPVEDVDPIASFYATVTRKTADGREFFPEQRMTRMEALRSYTILAAKAAFEGDIKGTLSLGKLADIVVLSKDILEIPAEEIREARVLLTIIGGKVVFERQQ